MEQLIDAATIFVNMLGEFSITIDGKTISDQNNQSKKPWSLLEYLVTFRDKELSSNELIEMIWGNSESSNPSGALKTLLFRVRKLLAPLDYPVQELVIQQRGSYSWVKELTTVTDVDRFETLCSKTTSQHISEDKLLSLCLEAIELYKGDFLPKSEWESWVIPISAYYHSLYQRTVHKALELLHTKKDYSTIIEVCQRAVAIENYDEDFHYYLIEALYESGNRQGALEHYSHTIDMFYTEFAITPSEHLKRLYKVICDKKHGVTSDLSLIQDILMEDSHNKGAFLCESSVFKDIYQLESRAIERTGDSIYLCLLTLGSVESELPKSYILTRAMDELSNSICTSLRRGDVYTRYSISQYLILLPSSTYENCELVLKRIISNYKKGYSRKNMTVDYSLQAVLPN